MMGLTAHTELLLTERVDKPPRIASEWKMHALWFAFDLAVFTIVVLILA